MTEAEFVERVEHEGGLVEFLSYKSAFAAPDSMRSLLIALGGALAEAEEEYERLCQRVEEAEDEDE